MWNVECRMWNVGCEILKGRTGRTRRTRRTNQVFERSRAALFALCVLCALSAPAQSATDRFLWDQANTQMTHATTPKEFLKAAKIYQRLLADEVVNPAILNNLGCALTMGRDYANAQRAFERAERYSGTTLETKEGVTAAISRRHNSEKTEVPWYKSAFFWHFRLPAHLRILTALAGWSMLWIGILFCILRRQRAKNTLNIFLTLSETFMITGGFIFLFFGASSLFSLIQEKQAETYWRNVEFSPMAINGVEEM